jgi:hypothetical protein
MSEDKYKRVRIWLWVLAFAVSVTAGVLLFYVRHRLGQFGIRFPF